MAPSFSPNDPHLEELANIHAERTRQIVYFVGSGLSRDAGLPDWQQLADILDDFGKRSFASYAEHMRTDKLAALARANKEPDLWLRFSRFHDLLGKASFRTAVSKAIKPASTCAIPDNYASIWRLPNVRGMITLNLDHLASRAAGAVGKHVYPITKSNINSQFQKLKVSSEPICVHLHGHVDDPDSWVLTRPQIDELQRTKSYQNFLTAIFSMSTVVFIGISASDRAAGGVLRRIFGSGVPTGPHFWITDQQPDPIREWASSADILPIYFSPQPTHQAAIAALLGHLAETQPHETTPNPIIPTNFTRSDSIDSPQVLEKKDRTEIRNQLNAYARTFLEKDGTILTEEYQKFVKSYLGAINSAALVEDFSPHNSFFHYTVKKKLGKGLFGQVYLAETVQGAKRAIKFFHADALRDPVMIDCFRRGAKSMQLLTQKNIDGAVKFLEAYELPPAIVMEFIEGETLEDAIKNRAIRSWKEALDVASKVSGIISASHSVKILHRDIRPANIMINRKYAEGKGADGPALEVTVLDFDLSWHEGAKGQSMGQKALQAFMYLSPEQNSESRDVSTKNAAVDSYCLGMTLYSLFTGRLPELGENRDQKWEDEIGRRIRDLTGREWMSSGRRVARLISRATRVIQDARPNIHEIALELSAIRLANESPNEVVLASMWAEEIAFRSLIDYELEPDGSFVRKSATRLVVRLKGNDGRDRVELSLDFTADHTRIRGEVPDYIKRRFTEAEQALEKGGWSLFDVAKERMAGRIFAGVDLDDARTGLQELTRSLEAAVRTLSQ